MKQPDHLDQRAVSLRRRWIRLLIGVVALFLFIFVIAPAGQRLGPIGEIHDYIDEQGIDASALYYTDSEEFSDLQLRMQNRLRAWASDPN